VVVSTIEQSPKVRPRNDYLMMGGGSRISRNTHPNDHFGPLNLWLRDNS
jgi:hypothetical protein